MAWGHILLGALVAIASSLLVTVLVVTGYASMLGFEARGAPDPASKK